MDQAVNVAVVRGANRRGAVAQALALIAADLRARVAPHVLIKPNLVSHRDPLASTHADTLSAVLDAVLDAGAQSVIVAEGATDASAGFERFGYRREAFGRPVRFLDLNREETEWEPIALTGVEGTPLTARLSRTVAQAACRVSLALAKTHVTAMVSCGLENMLASLHPRDRVMMHGHAEGGHAYHGWNRLVVEFLKQDNLAVKGLTRLMGRVKNARHAWRGRGVSDRFHVLSLSDLAFLRSVVALNRNLVALSRRVRPHVSVVDGFVGMHREGPRHGTPIALGTVIAGTDPIAVDAVAAAVMGFEPLEIGYLNHAQTAGLGVAELSAINVLGDPIAAVRRRFVPHSNHAIQQHWSRLSDTTVSAPRFLATVPVPRALAR